jgi:hypothetical protein
VHRELQDLQELKVLQDLQELKVLQDLQEHRVLKELQEHKVQVMVDLLFSIILLRTLIGMLAFFL